MHGSSHAIIKFLMHPTQDFPLSIQLHFGTLLSQSLLYFLHHFLLLFFRPRMPRNIFELILGHYSILMISDKCWVLTIAHLHIGRVDLSTTSLCFIETPEALHSRFFWTWLISSATYQASFMTGCFLVPLLILSQGSNAKQWVLYKNSSSMDLPMSSAKVNLSSRNAVLKDMSSGTSFSETWRSSVV